MESIKYIAQNQRDREWGLAVCSVGHQKIAPGEEYPPQKHNPEYMFDPSHGRVLPEYQMIYIADGKGALVTKSAGRINVCSGDMFILFPGEWHSYKPDESTGWNEYWIGFQGINIDNRVHAGFFSPEAPLFHIMTGSRNALKKDEESVNIVNTAKNLMNDWIEESIKMPDIADRLNISYTKFRRLFKQYTGLSPAQYFINLRIHRAKEMLRGTSASIKEISITLHFESAEYFTTMFRSRTGMTPTEFRRA